MNVRKVPQLSLGQFTHGTHLDSVRFVDDFLSGLKDYGFINLSDHPIKSETLSSAYNIMREYFDLPLEKKLQYISKAGGGQRGHTPFKREHARDSLYPDLKEFWHVGRELDSAHPMKSSYPDNLWPSEIPQFKKVMLELYQSMDEVSLILLKALGRGLDLGDHYFQDMVENGNSILRCIHYPPVELEEGKLSMRAAAHADINLITMLVGATSSGLELLDRDGQWLKVETKDNQIVVDSGDMLSRITNNVIPSTIHRVVNTDSPDTPFAQRARYSMPFFVHPKPSAVLECIPSCLGEGAKFPPITSNDFLFERLKEIGLM
jgi:isopenicillin N synthase-like dioxygenase